MFKFDMQTAEHMWQEYKKGIMGVGMPDIKP